MVLGVFILYWFPFYARLEPRRGVQSLYHAKMHPENQALVSIFPLRLGDLDYVANPAYPVKNVDTFFT